MGSPWPKFSRFNDSTTRSRKLSEFNESLGEAIPVRPCSDRKVTTELNSVEIVRNPSYRGEFNT